MFWLVDPTQGTRTKYVLAWSSIPLNLICKRTSFIKKGFDLLTPPPGSRVCLLAKYLLPSCCMSFPLNWYATWPYSENIEFWPRSPPREWDPGLWTKILFDMFHINWTSAWVTLVKSIDNWLKLLQNLNIWTLTPPNFFLTVMLIYRHWAIIAYSENLSDIIALGRCEVHYIKKTVKKGP